MRRLRAWTIRLAGLVAGGRGEREFAEELESHLQMHIDDNLRAGMGLDEARRQALLKLGGVEQAKLAYRERGTIPVLEQLAQDVRFAARQLRKNPGFTATAALVTGLGVAASVAIFAFVDATLLAPLPYRDPTRLVNVTESVAQIPRANLSYADYLDWKQRNRVLSSLEVHNGTGYMLSTPGGAQPVRGARVSGGFFRALGVSPTLGRDFLPGEDSPGAAPTAILSHAAWQRRFGGRDGVIGESVTLNGSAHTVVGVLPRDFHFAPRGRAEIWTPLVPSGSCELRRSCHNLTGVGRLKDAVAIETARAQMESIAAELERQYPDSNRGQGAAVEPLSDVIVGEVRPVLLVLLGGAALLLLIACVNVASLLLVRAESRRRELALRRALGASRGRLFAQFATEATVLVILGGALGLAAGHAAMQALLTLIPPDMLAGMPYLPSAGLNARVLSFAGAVSLVAVALFALVPAVRVSSSERPEDMAEGGRGTAGRTWRRLGARFVVVELATAVVLLVGAGLLGKSVHRLLRVDLAFNPDGLATLEVIALGPRYGEDGQAVALAHRVTTRAQTLPGVESVAITSLLPVSFNGNTDWIRFVGRPFGGEHNEVNLRVVSAGYFRTLQATLVRGRYFTEAEDASQPRVAIINEALARRYFAGQDPVGQRIGDLALSPGSIKEIVGVVGDIREGALDADIWPAVYYPFEQNPDNGFVLVARTSTPAGSMLPALTAAVRELDPDLGTIGEATMNERIYGSPTAYLRRSAAWLVGGFAAVALLLGVVGLYGVMAYLVSQRTREIGVRIALGAGRQSVQRLIVGEAGGLAAAGIGVGLLVSVATATFMRRILFGTPPWDVPTLAAVAVLLGGSALLASYLPARRAGAVDPIEALRTE